MNLQSNEKALGNKISKISAVDQVFGRIKSMILDGTFKVGDKLPSETVFADTFDVNRLTVRGALQKLNAYGIVESRVGNGTYVKEFYPLFWLNEIHDFWLSSAQLHDIYELRRALEIECCRLAIERATDEEKDTLRILSDNYYKARYSLLKNSSSDETLKSELMNRLLEIDLALHKHIYIMSHNKIFIDLFTSIEQHLRASMATQIKERVLFESPDFYDNHNVICDGILSGDYEKAKTAYLTILDDEFLLKKQEKNEKYGD